MVATPLVTVVESHSASSAVGRRKMLETSGERGRRVMYCARRVATVLRQ